MTALFRIRRLSVIVLAAASLVVAQAGTAAAADQTVQIKGGQFIPPSVTVNVGDTVTWANDASETVHSIIADLNAFETGDIAPGQSKSVTFNTPGAFIYHDKNNAALVGLVVVQAGSGSSATPSPTGTTEPAASDSPTASGNPAASSPAISASAPPTDTLDDTTGTGGSSAPLVLLLILAAATPIAWRLVSSRQSRR